MLLLFYCSLQYGTVSITADGFMLRQHFVASRKYVTNTPDSRLGEKVVCSNIIHLLSSAGRLGIHTEGEVYASNGVMSDLFSLTEPACSRRESMVSQVG